MPGPRAAHGLRPKRQRRGEDSEATVDTQRVPARPGTTETGRPSRDDLGRAQREDLKRIVSGDVLPPEDESPPPQGPAGEEHGRMDRKELTGQRAQEEERTDGDETDTQGGQRRGRTQIPRRR